MDKYAPLKRFSHDRLIQSYMYNFVYFDPDTMLVENHFLNIFCLFENYKKISTPGPVSKRFACI